MPKETGSFSLERRSLGFSSEKKVSGRRVDWRNPEALCEVMGERKVSIAVTPNG